MVDEVSPNDKLSFLLQQKAQLEEHQYKFFQKLKIISLY